MLPGPRFSVVSMSLSAISVSASSQEMRFHLRSPRAPTRFNGYLRKSGCFTQEQYTAPFWQPRGFMSGKPGSCGYSATCSSRIGTPSLTYTRHAQPATQPLEWVVKPTESQVHSLR
jgi:hypothetical protein